MTLLIRRAEVGGRGADVLLRDDHIARLTPPGAVPRGVNEVLDAAGGALLPGLVDHHLHLHALAAAHRSLPAGRTRADLARALTTATPDRHGWTRVVGSADDDLDAAVLDTLAGGDGPVRVQHRSGAMWSLNTAALHALGSTDHPGVEVGADGRPTGRIFRADDWLRSRLPASSPPDLGAVGRELAAYGITGLTDATPDLDTTAATSLTSVPQRLTLLGVPIGQPPPAGAACGPYKVVLADSALPDLDTLVELIRTAHGTGRAIAAHTVTRESLVLLLAALEEAGRHPGDRIEHAALVPAELVPALRGLTVVSQPGFIADRGDDYRRDLPAADHADLYRCRTLIDAGVQLALSSDAPYGPVDPWAVITAAMTRRPPDGPSLGSTETISARRALAAYLAPNDDPGGTPRSVRYGAPADLALLHVPLETALRRPDAAHVRATLIGGRVVTGG